MSSVLHEHRLEAVVAALRASGAETVLDLGCGPGPLLLRLLHEGGVREVVGIDASIDAVRAAGRRLRNAARSDIAWTLIHGSFAEADARLLGFDAAAMVETLEHVDPDRLSTVETAVFGRCRPATVIITTPNREYNPLLGVPEHRLRHPDHRFEWDRARFEAWSRGVAGRSGYTVAFEDVGWPHPTLGAPTQMAIFTRRRGADGTVPNGAELEQGREPGAHLGDDGGGRLPGNPADGPGRGTTKAAWRPWLSTSPRSCGLRRRRRGG